MGIEATAILPLAAGSTILCLVEEEVGYQTLGRDGWTAA